MDNEYGSIMEELDDNLTCIECAWLEVDEVRADFEDDYRPPSSDFNQELGRIYYVRCT